MVNKCAEPQSTFADVSNKKRQIAKLHFPLKNSWATYESVYFCQQKRLTTYETLSTMWVTIWRDVFNLKLHMYATTVNISCTTCIIFLRRILHLKIGSASPWLRRHFMLADRRWQENSLDENNFIGLSSLFWSSLGSWSITSGLLSILCGMYLIALFWKLIMHMFFGISFLFDVSGL